MKGPLHHSNKEDKHRKKRKLNKNLTHPLNNTNDYCVLDEAKEGLSCGPIISIMHLWNCSTEMDPFVKISAPFSVVRTSSLRIPPPLTCARM